MWNTFDRYLFGRFVHAFVVYYLAAFSLFAVFDAFTNLDAFQQTSRSYGTGFMLAHMARHYLYQSSSFLELIGPTAGSTAVMTVLALLVRHRELSAILAAGVPTYRLAVPFVAGVALVNALLISNQEFIVPHIAYQLQGSHEDVNHDFVALEPQYDSHMVYISGRDLSRSEGKVRSAEFRLPAAVSPDLTVIKAKRAVYLSAGKRRPAGWMLEDPQPKYDEIRLTDEGREQVVNDQQHHRIFIPSDLSFDQLLQSNTGYRYLSTAALFARLQQPAGSLHTARGMIMNLHARLTRPILSLIGVFLIIPLIIRREHDSQVGNLALCMSVVSTTFAFWLGFQLLGQTPLIQPEMAAWLPLVFSGALAAWLSGGVRT